MVQYNHKEFLPVWFLVPSFAKFCACTIKGEAGSVVVIRM
jgi:hypothetical protein